MMFTVAGREAYAYSGGKPFDATLPCIVFVHGALNDHSVWTLLARWFAHHGHAVLALDLPGHGRSTGAPAPSVQAAAQWLLALLDAAGVARAAVVGHSLGSLIALEAAAQAPGRITQLVMIGTAYPMKVGAALLDTARARPLAAIDMVNAFSLSSLACKPSFPGPGMWLHGSQRALMRRTLAGASGLEAGVGANLLEHDLRLCDRYAGGLEAAARVRCPAHVVLGRDDRMTSPKAARDIAAALHARVTLLAGGHSLMAEAPDALLAALRAALADAATTAAQAS
ncbi:MAG: alpha/beta hydrolase [Proteobacteria bacterium]|nr:alpha/beta hydrolase [Pseudomonadota bacterium]